MGVAVPAVSILTAPSARVCEWGRDCNARAGTCIRPVDVEAETLALGVDLGTGSARAFLFDGAGRRLAGVRSPYTWRTAVDGTVEADADRVVDLVFAAMDGAVSAVPGDATVAAVGFSALWHTVLGVDVADRPVTPVFAWSDTRSTAAAAALRRELDEARVHDRTGVSLHPSYPPAKLRWLWEAEPDLFGRARRWMSLPEYLWLRLTGEHVADVSIAAGSGLLHQAELAWDREVLEACGVTPGQLARVATGHEAGSVPGHGVTGAARWPQLRRATWRMPVGDGACATVGSGCHDRTGLALSIGTSAALRVVTHGGWMAPAPGLWGYRLDQERTVLGGAISNGGLMRAWLERTLRLPAHGVELDALLAARVPGAHGMSVLPFLAGERSPHWPLDATAAFAGVRLAHSGLDFMQAGMEAVAYRLALLRRRLRHAVPEAADIVASGGAIRGSPAWAQLLADVLGEPIRVTADAETSSRGAALLALEAAGIATVSEAEDPPTTRIAPDPERHRLHAAALERHTELEARLGG
jgi:gluconokinase